MGRGVHDILVNFADGGLWMVFGNGGYFSDSVDLHIYEEKTSFFHRISSFLTRILPLLHCFYFETTFGVNLKLYNGDTEDTLVFQKGWLGYGLFVFLSVLL